MELIIALVLFVGLIASWLLLPGTTSSKEAVAESAAHTAHSDPPGAVQQPA
ncbi:MAG: hypothetical protein M3R24_01610 [Chloroflexota bacterium]|nr:hypothetical protein [Chloroflexota bacterium]